MKKALAILMVLAAITGVVFADVADVAVTGNATLTWGMDLENDSNTGFKNETEWSISIPLLTKQTFSKKGEGNYAEINIVDAQFYIAGDHDNNAGTSTANNTAIDAGDQDIDSVNAKLVFGNVYMTIAGKPDFTPNNVDIFSPIDNDDYMDGVDLVYTGGKDAALEWSPGFNGYGTKIGYKAETFDVGVKIASLMMYDAAITDDTKSKYAFGFDASATPSEMITVAGTLNYAAWDGAVSGESNIMSAGLAVTAKPVADVTVKAALDAGNNFVDIDSEAAWAYEANASVAYKFVEAGMYYGSVGTNYTGHNADSEETGDMAVYAKLTDGKMVPNLTASFTLMAEHLLTAKEYIEATVDTPTVPLAFGVTAEYKYMMGDVNYIKPYANFYGQTMAVSPFSALALDKGTDLASCYEVGAVYGLFSNATVTAKFASGGTTENKRMALIGTNSKDDKGTFTVACKVTY